MARTTISEVKELPISDADNYKESRTLIKLGAEESIPACIEIGLQLGGRALENLSSVRHNIVDIKDDGGFESLKSGEKNIILVSQQYLWEIDDKPYLKNFTDILKVEKKIIASGLPASSHSPGLNLL